MASSTTTVTPECLSSSRRRQKRRPVAALFQIGDQKENGLCRLFHQSLTIGNGLGNIRPAAHLKAEQQIHRICTKRRQIHNLRVKGHTWVRTAVMEARMQAITDE